MDFEGIVKVSSHHRKLNQFEYFCRSFAESNHSLHANVCSDAFGVAARVRAIACEGHLYGQHVIHVQYSLQSI